MKFTHTYTHTQADGKQTPASLPQQLLSLLSPLQKEVKSHQFCFLIFSLLLRVSLLLFPLRPALSVIYLFQFICFFIGSGIKSQADNTKVEGPVGPGCKAGMANPTLAQLKVFLSPLSYQGVPSFISVISIYLMPTSLSSNI